ncbi:hypothetical protein GGS23DRAFT_592094 [Durotheca rogersii]|uniref:uncharacterized protein n=1 Tax=Durotheca rogersii TaxID=419775 RepID=UPI00221EA80B|nr:uncharacterized protein GGS23DRAFT_592094 [Durotheca rogersii]KAI5868310.1 hypothetical protein GGS23DRAFT_592094 [Durotheca rogersii]
MRPRIPSRRLSTRHRNFCARQFGGQPAIPRNLSLALTTKAPKRTVIEVLSRHLTDSPRELIGASGANGSDYAAAIFASRDVATWLQDETFISTLLGTLFEANAGGQIGSRNINVISAAVDGLTPNRLFGSPRTGFSIIYGSTSILPGLWDAGDSVSNRHLDRESSVSFLSAPLVGDTRPLEVTLPLANTIFQNGRQSTLFASKWQSDQSGYKMLGTTEKQTQVIRPHASPADHARAFIPLIPLTPPRKIVAGLGNIVRQVEVNGSATPASKELEGIIPKVFDTRSQRDGSYTPGPIGVWCWVLPPHVAEEQKQNLLNLGVFQGDPSQSEADLSSKAMGVFSELISSGCRLHKILSGGGGWGTKQGLLSLSPETTYSPLEEEDIETFIRAFQERNNPDSSEGLAAPGSHLVFCIEPHCTEAEVGSGPWIAPTAAVGVAPSDDDGPGLAGLSDGVEVIDGHFGVASKAGLFLKATTLPRLASSSGEGEPATPRRPFTTKVDVPRASLLL